MSTAFSADVSKLYVALFTRAPDTQGMNFWSTALTNASGWKTVIQGFLLAPEGQGIYPASASGETFIRTFYSKVFGREVDAGGLAFWLSVLESAGGNASVAARAQVVAGIVDTVSSPVAARGALDYTAYDLTLNDRATFANKVKYGEYLATASTVTTSSDLSLTRIDASPASLDAARADILSARVTSALGAKSVLSGTSLNDVFKLSAQDYVASGSGFAVDGAEGNDTLWLTNGRNTVNVSAAGKARSIETVQLSNAGTMAVDAASFAQATAFAVQDASGTINVQNLTASQSGVISGMSSATTTFSYTSGVSAASLQVRGASAGDSSVRLTGPSLRGASLSVDGVASKLGQLVLGDGVTALSIDAGAALSLRLSALTAGTAVTVKGTGSVDFGSGTTANVTVLDATQNEGGVRLWLSGAKTVLGGSGRDIVRLDGNVATGAQIALGAGNDALRGTASIAAGVIIDGGDGVDSVSTELLFGASASQFANVEILEIAQGRQMVDLAAFTRSSITGLSLYDGANGATTVINVPTGASLDVRGAAQRADVTTTIRIKGADTRADDAFTVNFTGSSFAQPYQAGTPDGTARLLEAGTLVLDGVEHVSVASGGIYLVASNALRLDDRALNTVSISGDKALSLSFASTGALSLIDGGSASGNLSISTANATSATGGLRIVTGSGNDVISLDTAATVTTGAGSDRILLNSGVALSKTSNLAAKMIVVTDYSVRDSLVWQGMSVGPTVGGTVFEGSTSADLLAAASAAVSGNTAVGAKAFRFGGELYTVVDADGIGSFGAGDVLVKLAGVAAL